MMPESPQEKSCSVLIAYSYDGIAAPEQFRAELREAAERVTEILQQMGADVRTINSANPHVDAQRAVESVHCVLVLGGADIAPETYGKSVEADNLYYVDANADRFEMELVHQAAELRLPLAGICRGSQVINVAFGGTLIQDLGSGLHNREITGDTWTDHEVELKKSSRLREMLTADKIVVRTGHHQAVDQVGDGLRPVAHAADGVIEAIEGKDLWILGVQWHPEESAGDPVALERLLGGFYAAALEQAATVH